MWCADILIFECGMPITDVENLPIDKLIYWTFRLIKHREKT